MRTAITAGVLAIAAAAAMNAQESFCNRAASAPLEGQARRAIEKHDYQTAASLFEEAFHACPEKRSILLDMAQSQISGRNFDAAIGSAKRYLEGDRQSAPARVLLANAYLMAQRFQDARSEAEAVLREKPDEPAALKVKANAAYFSGDFHTATDTFIRLLDRYPADADAAYMLGRIYYQEGYIDLAMGQFERALKLDSGSYKALDNLGLCYVANGDDEMATRYFLAAIKLVERDHAGYEWPYTNLADLLIKQDDPQKAFDAASKAANLNPLSARSFYVGAKALNHLGKTELALNWLQRATALNASSSESWYLLAQVYRKLQQNDKAQGAQQKFLELKAAEPAQRK